MWSLENNQAALHFPSDLWSIFVYWSHSSPTTAVITMDTFIKYYELNYSIA